MRSPIAADAPHPVGIAPPDLSAWAASKCGAPCVHELRASADLPGPDVLVTALVHGNEYSGAIVLAALLECGWRPARGRVTLAFCNVEAFARFDAAQPDASRFVDEDFNRLWSPQRLDSNQTSQELTRARLLRPFADRATHLLDLHSMHEPCAPLLLAGMLPRNLAFAQALQTPSQVIVDAGHADGVRLRDYGGFGDASGERIALLLEAGQHWAPSSVSVVQSTLMRFLVVAGACGRCDAPAGWLQPDSAPPLPVQVTDRVVATSQDFFFTAPYTGNETVAHAGTVIALDGGREIATPYDDCMLVMPSVRQLRPGVTTVRFGRRLLH